MLQTGRTNTGVAVRNSAFSLLSLGCRLAGNLVVFLVIARLPGVNTQEFGQLTYAVALASLFVMLSQFGLLPLLARDIAADPSRLAPYARSTLALRLLLTALGMTALATYAVLIGLDGQARLVCWIIGAALYIGAFSTDLQALFQSRERMHLELAGIASENLLLLGLALLAFLFHPGIVGVACVFLIAKSVGFLFNYWVCGRHLAWVYPRFDWKLSRKLLKEALPFALTGLIAAGIVQVDSILMRELAPGDGEAAVGVYQAAMRLFLLPMLLPEIVLKVFLPQLSRMHRGTGPGLVRDLGRVNHVLMTLGLLIAMATLFRGHDLVVLLYGERYAEAGPLLSLLGISILMRFGAAYNLYYTLNGRVWFRVFSALLALSAVIALDFLLIPRYGPMGAVYASILAHVVYWAPYITGLYRAERTVLLGWKIGRAILATAGLALFMLATMRFPLLVMMPFYLAAGAVAIFAALPPEDRDRLRSLLPARSR